MKKAIWITWENQIRNKSMAAMLGVDLHVVSHGGGRLCRYLSCAVATTLVVGRIKPDVVFAQNPSIVLNYLLLLGRIFFRYTFVSDAHFGGVIAYNGNYFFQKALDLCNRSADLVIVTNSDHADHVKAVGGNALVCEDPLPKLDGYEIHEKAEDKAVFFICSFDIDEPYQAAFEAARMLNDDNFKFYVSGNYHKVGIDPAAFPEIDFLGFVPERRFYEQLFQSDIVLDLTEHENCLVCGAYEAMAAEKPLVTSDKICLRKYFDKGTMFTQHDSRSIAESLRIAYRDRIRLKGEINEWKTRIIGIQNERKAILRQTLGLD
jgi:glycosyltransferase involved in cell wall biosynthesis